MEKLREKKIGNIDTFSIFSAGERMNLSGMRLGVFPYDLCQLPHSVLIKYLVLDKNGLTQVPREICDLSELRYLDLSYNKLVLLPDELGRLRKLKHLGLDNNCLKEIPHSVLALCSLDVLFVSNNPDLPAWVHKFAAVITLRQRKADFSNLTNQLSKSLVEISLLRQVTQSLSLASCSLETLGAGLNRLRNLTELNLRENLLTSLPDGFCSSLIHLEVLDVSSNRLQGLDASFGKLRKLSVLSLDDNFFVEVPDALFLCTSLQKLSMEGNKLKSLEKDFTRLISLREVHFGRNRIHYVDVSLFELPLLHSLYLHHNSIISLPVIDRSRCPLLDVVDLDYNFL